MPLRSLLLPLAALLAAGCATMQDAPVPMHAAAPLPIALPAPAAQPQPAAGAIYNVGNHRPLFEDRRARLAGDTLTIVIEEQLSASQQSASKIDRNGSVSAATTALPWASARLLGRLGVGANSAVGGNADGKTNTSNSFSGTITVLVQQVLPNGNLLVAGDKQIGVNGNVDVLRFSGIVAPSQIRAGNVVSSTQVAEARVEQKGRGDVGRIQPLGWLSRFFLSVAPV